MRGSIDHPFTPGTEVLVNSGYSSYGRGTFKADIVLKVHKTGRFTLKSNPAEQWYAQRNTWEEDKAWFGYRTKREGYSIYSTRLRLMDEKAKAEMASDAAIRGHEKRCDIIATMFAKPKNISHEMSAKVAAILCPPSAGLPIPNIKSVDR